MKEKNGTAQEMCKCIQSVCVYREREMASKTENQKKKLDQQVKWKQRLWRQLKWLTLFIIHARRIKIEKMAFSIWIARPIYFT